MTGEREEDGAAAEKREKNGKSRARRIVGVYRFLFSVAVETFEGRTRSFIIVEGRRSVECGRNGEGSQEMLRATGARGMRDRVVLSLCDRRRPTRAGRTSERVGQSWCPVAERTRCLFVPAWVSQHTHCRPQRGAN